ncbi:MAG: hypothetical protein JRI22_11860 [Deltaproteobacteria bacterium]|nr:hypothetical protein [Deltaproteobacteria bacterium]
MPDPSKEALERASTRISEVKAHGSVSGRQTKFLWFQLLDAYRLSAMTRALADCGMQADIFTAEAIEVLVRKVVEHAIIAGYVAQEPVEVVDRFLKTSAEMFEKSWKEEHYTEDKNLNVSCLPDYRQMAKKFDAALYDTYRRLSHLAHPRVALPHALVEHEYLQRERIDRREFYRRRAEQALIWMAQALNSVVKFFDMHFSTKLSGSA